MVIVKTDLGDGESFKVPIPNKPMGWDDVGGPSILQPLTFSAAYYVIDGTLANFAGMNLENHLTNAKG